jgi:hypothetical protein
MPVIRAVLLRLSMEGDRARVRAFSTLFLLQQANMFSTVLEHGPF